MGRGAVITKKNFPLIYIHNKLSKLFPSKVNCTNDVEPFKADVGERIL